MFRACATKKIAKTALKSLRLSNSHYFIVYVFGKKYYLCKAFNLFVLFIHNGEVS